jgi:hypothetical protein
LIPILLLFALPFSLSFPLPVPVPLGSRLLSPPLASAVVVGLTRPLLRTIAAYPPLVARSRGLPTGRPLVVAPPVVPVALLTPVCLLPGSAHPRLLLSILVLAA